ncbi:MAG: hypothetical protein RRZ24_10285 [Clostridia bacterium]
MAYLPTGLQALFPIYLSRMNGNDTKRDDYDIAVAQNEANLNQNLETLYLKLIEIETNLAKPNAATTEVTK